MPFISQFSLFLSNNSHAFHKATIKIEIPIQSFGVNSNVRNYGHKQLYFLLHYENILLKLLPD